MKKKLLMKLYNCFVILLFLGESAVYGQSAYPVSLSSPMDYDTIIETEPNFNWQTNLSAIQTDPRSSQRFVLCELENNQLKGDAIAINTPILVLEDYQNLMYSYSSSSTPLEEGHTYVWQVSVLFNSLIVDQSEPYQFTIFESADIMPKFYPVVFKNDRQTYQLENGKIGLVTDETGTLNLELTLQLNGKYLPIVYLNEFLDGELQTQTTSEDGLHKRMFILNTEALDLDPGQYAATWSPKKGKKYVFNFTID